MIRVSGKEFALSKAEKLTGYQIERRPGGFDLLIPVDDVGKEDSTRPRIRATSHSDGKTISWNIGGRAGFGRKLEKMRTGTAASGGAHDLVAQFPGKVRKIMVKDGDSVKAGDKLVLVEAMKMEFAIQAPYDGKVKILVEVGEQVQPGDSFVDLKRG